MSLMNILKGLAEVEKEIEPIRDAYDRVPESLKVFPCIINVPYSGEYNIAYGGNSRHIITATILVDRAELPQAQNKTLPLMDAFRDKIDENGDLNGKCSSCMITGYRDYGVHNFAGTDYFGVIFDIEILE